MLLKASSTFIPAMLYMGTSKEYAIYFSPFSALTPHQPNILVENSGHVRIADFGLTKVTTNPYSKRDPSRQDGYSTRWVAPEVLSMNECNKKADIFSFAMVMIEVRRGQCVM